MASVYKYSHKLLLSRHVANPGSSSLQDVTSHCIF